MPLLNGLDATRMIRESGIANSKELPIVALTASAFREDVEECLAAGMTDHIAKPIETEVLLNAIEKYTKN